MALGREALHKGKGRTFQVSSQFQGIDSRQGLVLIARKKEVRDTKMNLTVTGK